MIKVSWKRSINTIWEYSIVRVVDRRNILLENWYFFDLLMLRFATHHVFKRTTPDDIANKAVLFLYKYFPLNTLFLAIVPFSFGWIETWLGVIPNKNRFYVNQTCRGSVVGEGGLYGHLKDWIYDALAISAGKLFHNGTARTLKACSRRWDIAGRTYRFWRTALCGCQSPPLLM